MHHRSLRSFAAVLSLGLLTTACRGERRSADRAPGDDPAAATATSDSAALLTEFASGTSSVTSLAFDAERGRIWLYGAAGLVSFTTSGQPLDTIPAPGERADDVDLDVAPAPITMAGVAVPAGTLLFINGESGPAEIYAIDSAGTVLATLATAFGSGHVVGGAWHPGRSTFFLVQDNQPSGDQADRVAEIDPATGRVLHSFALAPFSVHYGDLDVNADGNLVVASSSQSHLAVFSPDGRLVRHIPLPAGVSSISGIALDGSGNGWAGSTSGTVWSLAGVGR